MVRDPEDSAHARDRIAARLFAKRELLTSRIRAQLGRVGGPVGRTDDVFSTTLRRTDVLVRAGRVLESISDDGLLALATAIARNAAHEARREAVRDGRRSGAAGEVLGERDSANPFAPAVSHDDAYLIERIRRSICPEDLTLLELRLRGADWPVLAAQLGTTPAGAHRRFYRILSALAALHGSRNEP